MKKVSKSEIPHKKAAFAVSPLGMYLVPRAKFYVEFKETESGAGSSCTKELTITQYRKLWKAYQRIIKDEKIK